MNLKSRKSHRSEDGEATDGPSFEHASGCTDLASVLGVHTLTAELEAATVAPKGYRARSIAKPAASRR
jgi:hypothetical protein